MRRGSCCCQATPAACSGVLPAAGAGRQVKWWRNCALPPNAEGRLQQYHIKNLEIVHVRGDPRSMVEMRKLVKVENFKAAVVVSDSLWCALLQGLAAIPPAASVLAAARTCISLPSTGSKLSLSLVLPCHPTHPGTLAGATWRRMAPRPTHPCAS